MVAIIGGVGWLSAVISRAFNIAIYSSVQKEVSLVTLYALFVFQWGIITPALTSTFSFFFIRL